MKPCANCGTPTTGTRPYRDVCPTDRGVKEFGPVTPYYEHAGIKIYHGDCREILPQLPKVDAVITDPPYGVAFSGSVTRHSSKSGQRYASFEDTPESVQQIVVPAFKLALGLATRAAVTPGIRNARMYPPPDGEGVFWYPSGANRGPWGFVTHQPIFYYGKCPYLATGEGSRPTGFQSTEAAEENGHPCPKPYGQISWLMARGTSKQRGRDHPRSLRGLRNNVGSSQESRQARNRHRDRREVLRDSC